MAVHGRVGASLFVRKYRGIPVVIWKPQRACPDEVGTGSLGLQYGIKQIFTSKFASNLSNQFDPRPIVVTLSFPQQLLPSRRSRPDIRLILSDLVFLLLQILQHIGL